MNYQPAVKVEKQAYSTMQSMTEPLYQ